MNEWDNNNTVALHNTNMNISNSSLHFISRCEMKNAFFIFPVLALAFLYFFSSLNANVKSNYLFTSSWSSKYIKFKSKRLRGFVCMRYVAHNFLLLLKMIYFAKILWFIFNFFSLFSVNFRLTARRNKVALWCTRRQWALFEPPFSVARKWNKF